MRISDWSSDVCSSDLFVQRSGDDWKLQMAVGTRAAMARDVLHHAHHAALRQPFKHGLAKCGDAHRLMAQRAVADAVMRARNEIGRARMGERVCPDVKISMPTATFKKKKEIKPK